jgi:hypothetical protein
MTTAAKPRAWHGAGHRLHVTRPARWRRNGCSLATAPLATSAVLRLLRHRDRGQARGGQLPADRRRHRPCSGRHPVPLRPGHRARRSPRRPAHRRRTGAYYETIVAAQLINAGFELEFENEDDRRRTHCEFTATASTGKQFSVEAKSRPLVVNADEESCCALNASCAVLEKKAAHTRIVFIDLNVPTSNDAKARNQVFSRAQRSLRRAQTRQIDYHPAPPAYVFLSNVPDQYNLEDTCFSHFTVGEGFNIADFGPDVGFESLRAAVRAREKHIEVFQLLQSLREHSRIPITSTLSLRRWV